MNTQAVVDLTQSLGWIINQEKSELKPTQVFLFVSTQQLNSGSLHKQTRRNSLSRDVHSPVEDHDMVSSLSHNIKSQIHSWVSECDG